MSEEELKAKAEELTAKEGEIAKKEEELNAREQSIVRREADASEIAKTLKEEFDKKLEAQKQEFEERLKQRDEVIRQLADGENAKGEDENDPFVQLNNHRRLQKAA